MVDVLALSSLSAANHAAATWQTRLEADRTVFCLYLLVYVVDCKFSASVVLQGIMNSFWKRTPSLLFIFICKAVENQSTWYLNLNFIWSQFCCLRRNLGRGKTFWCIVWHVKGLANLVLWLLDYLDCELDKDRALSGLHNSIVTSWFLGTCSGKSSLSISSWALQCTHPNLGDITQPATLYDILMQEEPESKNTDATVMQQPISRCTLYFLLVSGRQYMLKSRWTYIE